MEKIQRMITGQSLSEKLQALHISRPRLYLSLAIATTMLGYVLIFLPPLLTFIAGLNVMFSLSEANSWDDWLAILIWMGIALLSGFMSLLMLRMRVSVPSGLGIKPDKAPKLYELLDELKTSYKHPTIHRVVLHDQLGCDFIVVPRFGLPLLNINVLYIGMPVLQGLSPSQFKGLLGRKLGQYSMSHNRLTHWIYRFRQYAALYQHAYTKQSRDQWFYLPFKWFFFLFVPYLNAITIHAARRDELESDLYSLEIMNDEEFADVLIRYYIVEAFIKEKYWPKIYDLLRKNPKQPDFLPHSSMNKVLRNGLTDHEVATTLETLIKKEPAWDDPIPSLHARLDHISFRKLSLPPPVLETAAQRFLGNACPVIIKLMDQQWLARHGIKTKKNRKNKSEVATATPDAADSDKDEYQQLTRQSNDNELSDDQLHRLAVLSEKFSGKAAAVAHFQQILKRNPQHAKTWFAIGRILLTQQDDAGIKALEKAMELDKGCIGKACWLLAKYFKSQGQEATAKKYIEMAARYTNSSSAAA